MKKTVRRTPPKPRNAVARALADTRYHKRVVPDRRARLLAAVVRKTIKELVGGRLAGLLPASFLQHRTA